jgi:DNA polymerase-3 subunit delta
MAGSAKSGGQVPGGAIPQKPVYLVFGNEEYEVSECAKRMVDHCCPPDQQSFGLETLDGAVGTVDDAVAVARRLLESLRTVGFLASSKVVWLRDASFLGESPQGKSEQVKQVLDTVTEDIKKGLPDGVQLIVSAPSVSRRGRFYKACQAAGEVRQFEQERQSYKQEAKARESIGDILREYGLEAAADVPGLLVQMIGTDTRQLRQEIEKLDLYLGERRRVTPEDLSGIVSATRESLGWELTGAVGDRDLEGALRVWHNIQRQKQPVLGVVMMLESFFRQLDLIRACFDRGWVTLSGSGKWVKAAWREDPAMDQALEALGRDDPRKLNPYRLGRLIAQARGFSTRELLRAQNMVARAHEKLVSSSMPQAILLEILITQLVGRRRTS